ncbi:Hsp20/alpha crystallin family protein [Salarchaeum sp. JOR-1]|uniref:Hsp20/alpha crystallin family protein n=1 Tax=Salarchaeum sp. JOR-1 TaxID=2599399 RepID=UPI001198588D|nr:Hsp20/alpha crystallin family protein [Salarchaeum sp. JOR-1]QDX40094.1 Hsp20/alpha crystallin family protein [Salarchaeum sp. JOR-1]
MTRRRSPFDEFERLFDRMSNQFDEFEEFDVESRLAVDVEDTGDAFVVTADLPGFEKEDIDVHLRDDTLQVDATHEASPEDDVQEQYIRRERSKRSVSRSLSLPESVDEDAVSASFNNGVLTVELPKASGEDDSTSIDIA